MAVAVGRVVVAEDVHHLQHLHAFGLNRDEDLRLARVARRVRLGDAHHDHDLAARVTDARGPPFLAVEHPLVSLEPRFQGDVGGVRGSDLGLGHRESRADLSVEQGLQPLLFLLLGAVALDHFHVAGVGRGAVHRLR